MNYFHFLEQVVDDGIAAVKVTYAESSNKGKLEGAIAGFEACKGKAPDQLYELLKDSRKQTIKAYQENHPQYWYYRHYELQVEWTCNVVGAMLDAQKIPHKFTVTARGMFKADEVLKRAKVELN